MVLKVENMHDAFPYRLAFECLANGYGLSERGRSAVLRFDSLSQFLGYRISMTDTAALASSVVSSPAAIALASSLTA
jgi:hypothetical protein